MILPILYQYQPSPPISSDAHSRFGSNPLRLDDLFSNGETQYLDKEQKHKTKPNSNSFHKSQKENPSVIECAKLIGINPSFDLPFPDTKDKNSTENLENKIQTLLFSDKMETKLSGLLNQIRIGLSEMGVNTLYCAWGFLEWYESEDSDTPMFAPLVLLALQMKRTLARHTYRYSVESIGEDVEINLTLRERLRQDFAMELPSFEETDMSSLICRIRMLEKC